MLNFSHYSMHAFVLGFDANAAAESQHLNLPLAIAKQQEHDTYLPNLRVHIIGGTYFALRTLNCKGFNISRWQRI